MFCKDRIAFQHPLYSQTEYT